MSEDPTVEDALVAGVADWAARVDDRVRRHAEALLADWLACAAAGLADPAIPSPRDDPLSRAAAWAAAGARHDRDDVHWDALVHPGSIVWPAALATPAPASGEAALAGVVAGYEVIVRLAHALGSGHSRRWHATATCGIAGAATAAAVATGLDHDRLAAALGHALSVAGGLGQCLVERSGTRAFHRAHAAVSGLCAVRFATAGLPGTRRGLTGARGAFAVLGDQPRPDALSAPGPPAILGAGVRIYPVSGFFHSAVHAVRQLRTRTDRLPDLIEVAAPDGVVAASPVGETDPWWRLDLAVAAAWHAEDPQRLPVTHPAVEELRRRVRLRPCGTGVTQAEVTAVLGGQRVTARVARPPGVADLTSDDLALCEAKWQAMTAGASLAGARRVLAAADARREAVDVLDGLCRQSVPRR